MEELFRFMLTRPAQRVVPADRTVSVRPSADYHARLRDARSSDAPRAELKRVALEYAGSPQALKSINDLNFASPLRELIKAASTDSAQALSAPSADSDKSNKVNALIKKLFGRNPSEVVADAKFSSDRERLSDILVTNTILSQDGAVSSDDAAPFLRAATIVERAAVDDPDLAAKNGLADAMARTLLLPNDIFPISSGTVTPPPSNLPSDVDEQSKTLRTKRDLLLATYNTLTHIAPENFVAPSSGPPIESGIAPERKPQADFPPVVPSVSEQPVADAPPAPTAPKSGSAGRTTSGPLLIRPEVVAAFSAQQQAVLSERGLDLTRVSLPSAVDRLSLELQEADLQLARQEGMMHKRMVRLGNTYTDESALAVGNPVSARLSFATVPTTHGTVAPAGIGDLLVVKQSLKRYEARELAHIENILKGEYKERIHSRARTTEETITTETETKREEERDQQTTERFELKSESSQIQKEDLSLKIGLAVSGKYGPTIEFKATTDFALNKSKEEATKIATSYSKDVTNRATTRIFERRREERILKTIEVFEEKNTHGVDNKAGSDHVIGQYQWVDKVYEAQVFNYGKRLLFDIMLPEPAAFLLHALSAQPKAGADLIKPTPFTLMPTDITEWNYPYYVQQYEVVGVTPPPQPYLAVAKAVEGKGTEDDGSTKLLEIPLPDGYQAVAYQWDARYNDWDDSGFDVVVLPEPIDNRVGTIVLAVKTRKVEAYTVSLAIHCQRTPRLLDDWKLKTHSAILQAYQKQLRDYEERLAALEVQAAQQIQGRNPLENEQMIRTEIKKGAISVFTAQHYDLFGAIDLSPQGYPQPNLLEAAAEGKYIRFFEQAFEWEQMMFFFYPYYWGRKQNWLKRALLQDTDPLFAEFVKAGSARVVLAVRPGFEQAIAHFLDTGETWDGGDLPEISSPLYVNIIEEIRERDKASGSELPQGDPWDVRLPTTLIKLRDEKSLPAWRKNSEGEWVPV